MTEVPEKPYGDWMQTFTGQAFYPADPMLMLAWDRIKVEDIAHALSMLCRYGGHVKRFYSVAEHSLLVSLYCDPKDALAGLLHDATEAYMQDMVRPVKNMMPEYRLIEDNLMAAIAKCFHFDGVEELRARVPGKDAEVGEPFWWRYTLPDSVKHADNRILLDERRALLGPVPQPWHPLLEALEPLNCTDAWVQNSRDNQGAPWDWGLTPHLAKALWLQRFAELTRDAPWRG